MARNTSSSSTEKASVLRQTDLFGTLSDTLTEKIAGLAVSQNLNRGQVLFSEHEEASGLFVVADGELRSVRQNAEGREQVLSTERRGSVLAAVPVFNGGKYYSTMISGDASEVLRMEKHHVHQLCREHTELLWNLARVLAHKVRHYAELIESLALRNVEQRLAQHLLTLARDRKAPVSNGCTIELALTRAEIASRIGSVREVVSRAFTDLQKRGLIQMTGRRLVTVPNLEALNAFAGTESHGEKREMASDLSSEMA